MYVYGFPAHHTGHQVVRYEIGLIQSESGVTSNAVERILSELPPTDVAGYFIEKHKASQVNAY